MELSKLLMHVNVHLNKTTLNDLKMRVRPRNKSGPHQRVPALISLSNDISLNKEELLKCVHEMKTDGLEKKQFIRGNQLDCQKGGQRYIVLQLTHSFYPVFIP